MVHQENALVRHVAVQAEEPEVVVAGDGAADGEGVPHGRVRTLLAAKDVRVFVCVCTMCMRVRANVYVWSYVVFARDVQTMHVTLTWLSLQGICLCRCWS